MGAYVSQEACASDYNTPINCHANITIPSIGGVTPGHFQANPDIAGTGVVNVFFSVTAFALGMSVIYLGLQMCSRQWKFSLPFTGLGKLSGEARKHPGAFEKHRDVTVPDIFEGLIRSCSDQQIFTGGAYALTLRYWYGCKISAYHYNIVANMLLMTCATHLMALSVISKYWQNRALALVRVLLITGLFTVTGVFLSNQNASSHPPFPTDVPEKRNIYSPLIFPAACFQDEMISIGKTLNDSMANGADHFFVGAIGNSSPKNHVSGWRFYLLILLWYGAAILAEAARFFWRRRRNPTRQTPSRRELWRKWLERMFCIYQLLGVGLGTTTIIFTRNAIMKFREWMDSTSWIELDHGRNPENDPTSYGQLVAIFMTGLTVFTFIDLVFDKFEGRLPCLPAWCYEDRGDPDPEDLPPSMPALSPDKKNAYSVQVDSVPTTPGTFDIQSSPLVPSTPSTARPSPMPSPMPSYPAAPGSPHVSPPRTSRPPARVQTFDAAQLSPASSRTTSYHRSTMSS